MLISWHCEQCFCFFTNCFLKFISFFVTISLYNFKFNSITYFRLPYNRLPLLYFPPFLLFLYYGSFPWKYTFQWDPIQNFTRHLHFTTILLWLRKLFLILEEKILIVCQWIWGFTFLWIICATCISWIIQSPTIGLKPVFKVLLPCSIVGETAPSVNTFLVFPVR